MLGTKRDPDMGKIIEERAEVLIVGEGKQSQGREDGIDYGS